LSRHPPADSYTKALAELEDILADIENPETDVDSLATKVARAAELLDFCRKRLRATEVEVSRIVAQLETGSDPADAPDSGDPSTPF